MIFSCPTKKETKIKRNYEKKFVDFNRTIHTIQQKKIEMGVPMSGLKSEAQWRER